MATQGVVSVVENGRTVIKAVAGSNGMNALALARYIEWKHLTTAEEVYEAARQCGFGGVEDLVVMDAEQIIYKGSSGDEELTFSAYRETFVNPRWNPRWHHGTADHVEIVKRGEPAPEEEAPADDPAVQLLPPWRRVVDRMPPTNVQVLFVVEPVDAPGEFHFAPGMWGNHPKLFPSETRWQIKFDRVCYPRAWMHIPEMFGFDGEEVEHALVRLLGERIGFGNLMFKASVIWGEKERGRGGEHRVGPCAALTVECGCAEGCDWCEGTRWLTKKVKEMKDEAAAESF